MKKPCQNKMCPFQSDNAKYEGNCDYDIEYYECTYFTAEDESWKIEGFDLLLAILMYEFCNCDYEKVLKVAKSIKRHIYLKGLNK